LRRRHLAAEILCVCRQTKAQRLKRVAQKSRHKTLAKNQFRTRFRPQPQTCKSQPNRGLRRRGSRVRLGTGFSDWVAGADRSRLENTNPSGVSLRSRLFGGLFGDFRCSLLLFSFRSQSSPGMNHASPPFVDTQIYQLSRTKGCN